MPSCTVCNSNDVKQILKWGRFDINLCKSCNLVFADPMPDIAELIEFYNGFLFNVPVEYEIQKQKVKRHKELKKLFKIGEQNSAKYLDYGAGTGVAFSAAKELGFDAYYFDLDDQAKAFTKEYFGLEDDKIVEDLATCEHKFDYIFTDNVIEHVIDPEDFVRQLTKYMNPGATMVIKTPHARNKEILFTPLVIYGYFKIALKHNSFGKVVKGLFTRFWHCDPPRHLYSFSKASLEQLAKNLNDDSLTYNVEYYRVGLFQNTLTKGFFSRDKRLKWYQSIVYRIALLPVIPIESFLQFLKWILVSMNIISKGGIILRVEKKA